MACCHVSIEGKDRKTRSTTLDAVSAFDAVEKATWAWGRLWWFDPDAIVTVQRGEQQYRIRQAKVREWRDKRLRRASG